MQKPIEDVFSSAEALSSSSLNDRRREWRKHRIVERLALGDSRERAERYADAVDAWLRRLDAEEAAT